MSGIFRSTSLNNSNDSPRTPYKRFSICTGAGATLCTSPGGIQDVTMENSYTSFDAGRAPGGIHSPMQGRSMRELEEQMSTLRKENFNLKLRIYFMEESQQGARGKKEDEPLSKQLIDSKIEIEILRKRVDEKTELLKDAARAITQHEEMQKKSDLESQSMIEQMQQYINQLESNAKQRATRKSMETLSAEQFKSLEAEVLKLENALRESDLRLSDSNKQLEIMENTLADRQETLIACEAKIEELAIKNAELVEQLEKEGEAGAAASQTISRQELELRVASTENSRLLNNLNVVERKVQRQNKWIGEAVNILDVQKKTLDHFEDLNLEKERAHTRLFFRMIQYESLLNKECCEVDFVQREQQLFQNLSKHCLNWMAMVHPTGFNTNDHDFQLSPRSILATSSIFFDYQGLQGFTSDKKFKFSMPEHCKAPKLTLSVAAPSTAFHNHSLPPFTGLRQLLYRWCTPHCN